MKLIVLVLLAGCDRLFSVPFAPDAQQCDKLAPEPDDADADCIADAADNCPGHANVDQADGDSDGVGDACDPAPEEPGDALLGFEDFDDRATATWEEFSTTGRFVFEPGSVVHGNVGEAGSYLRRTQPAPDTSELVFEVAMRFDAWGDRSNYPRIRLFVDEGSTPQQGLYCALDADPFGVRENLVLGDPVGGATISSVALLQGPHAIRMRMRREPSLLSCDVVVDGETTQLPMHPRGRDITWPTDRGIGVALSLVSVRIDWIAIYTASR